MSLTRWLVRAGPAAAILAALALLWPAALGGRTTYVVTHGVSMQPRFHTGDLAVLRPAASYRPGEVIAYHSRVLGVTVMHRIVGRHGDRFVVRGDNNGWLDPDEPSAADVSGRLWLRIPRAGTALRLLHAPFGLALEGAAVLAILTAAPTRRRHRRRAGRPRLTGPPGSPRHARPPWMAHAARALPASVAAALLLSGTAAVLVHLPASVATTTRLTLAHAPRFGYHGTALAGVTYPDGRVRTGQPVYLRLVRDLEIHLDDRVRSGRAVTGAGVTGAGVTGTTSASVRVTVRADGGWSSTVTQTPSTRLGLAGLDVPVHLRRAIRSLDRMRRETGSTGGAATVTVDARLTFVGLVAGHPVRVGASPRYAFTLDPTALRPPVTTPGSAGTATSVTLPATAPRTVPVLGHRLSLRWLRDAGTGAALVAWAVVALGAAGSRTRAEPDPSAQAAAVLAARLVPVTDLPLAGPVVPVASARALLSIADRYDRLVLHLPGRLGCTFAVRDESATYVLTVPLPEDRLRRVA